MTSDTKERNLCFAYQGEPLQSTQFECLYFHNAQGTYCREDGMWYIRISLDRNHGRRAVNIPNIIDEYNEKVDARYRIKPASIPGMPSIITCFKSTGPSSKNHILNKLYADSKSNSTYWCWNKKTPPPTSQQDSRSAAEGSPPKRKHASKASLSHPKMNTAEPPITTGLEGLAREMNLDPSILDMQGAYIQIARNYYTVHNTTLRNTGQFEAKDKDFLAGEMGRYFHSESAFVTKPFDPSTCGSSSKKIKRGSNSTVAALVAANGGSASDFDFIREDQDAPLSAQSEPNPYTSCNGPNDTICSYFRGVLPQWLQRTHVETVEIAAKDIVTSLNGGHEGGTYRSTCVPGFLRPFVSENLIRPADASSAKPTRYIVNVKGMARKLNLIN